MRPLSVFEALRDEPLPREAVEGALRNALRARELIETSAFRWWRSRVEEGLQKRLDKLVTDDGDIGQIRRKQGIIIGIQKVFDELDRMAESVETLQERMQEYDRDS